MYEQHRAAVRAYLDDPLDTDTTGIVVEWDDYLKLFKQVKGEIAIGEVSGTSRAGFADTGYDSSTRRNKK